MPGFQSHVQLYRYTVYLEIQVSYVGLEERQPSKLGMLGWAS